MNLIMLYTQTGGKVHSYRKWEMIGNMSGGRNEWEKLQQKFTIGRDYPS